MHIKRLELKNFRGFANASVDFPEGNVAVFFGWNGAGKTAVLDAVAVVLDCYLTPQITGLVSRHFQDDSIQVGKQTVSINSVFQDEFGERRKISVSKTLGAALNFGSENALLKKSEHLPLLSYYKVNRESATPKEPLFGLDLGKDSIGWAYADFWGPSDERGFYDFNEWFRREEDIENQQKIEKRDFTWENSSLKSIRRGISVFLSKMDADFSGLRVQRQSNGAMDFLKPSQQSELYIQKAGQELKLSQLSSGERSLILLVADIARRASILNPQLPDPLQSDGIVLIDEIELHLHPKWQRAVIPALRATFPNIQFIIATHSPQVLSEVENGAVFEIDNFQIRPRHTYGRDNDWVLHVIMEDEERPKEVQADLEQYFALLRSDQLDAAAHLRQQIEAKIGTDDPELVKADILVRRKERAVAS